VAGWISVRPAAEVAGEGAARDQMLTPSLLVPEEEEGAASASTHGGAAAGALLRRRG
jgi:hypothetical protein